MTEQIFENGIVVKVKEGIAEIALIEEGACEDCHAKLFCNPKVKDDLKTISAVDPIGVKPGDEVRIAIAGSTILKASLTLYGVPLLIILLGIVFGMMLFKESAAPEVFSMLAGFGATAIYYAIIWLTGSKGIQKVPAPKIVQVRRTEQLSVK